MSIENITFQKLIDDSYKKELSDLSISTFGLDDFTHHDDIFDIFVAITNGENNSKSNLVGYSSFLDIGDGSELMQICINSSYRRQNIATKLLDSCLAHMSTPIFLEVRETNYSAQQFYYKYGFKQIGLRKNYYHDTGESALVLKYSGDQNV